MQSYNIVLNNLEDKESFIHDMNSHYHGPNSIPHRPCSCTSLFSNMNIIKYELEADEAELLKKDKRVAGIELCVNQRPGVQFQTHDNITIMEDLFLPGMEESYSNQNIEPYYIVPLPTTGTFGFKEAKIFQGLQDFSDRNLTRGVVDVIICDQSINRTHIEFNTFPTNGGGVNRVQLYNWAQNAKTLINISYPNTYIYPNINESMETLEYAHGTHVAGIATGNSQGWAKNANIYSIRSPGGKPPGGLIQDPANPNFDPLVTFAYIVDFHQRKPINPLTNRRNPTVVNMSWGYTQAFYKTGGYNLNINEVINSITYRGVTTTRPVGGWNPSTLIDRGLLLLSPDNVNYFLPRTMPLWDLGVETGVQNMINNGIIVVGAASNQPVIIAEPTSPDWDNFITLNTSAITGLVSPPPATYFYNRGSSPTSGGCINVGASDTLDRKAYFSPSGDGVDVYAPGIGIMSATTPSSTNAYPTVIDPRSIGNTPYRLQPMSGTSMSSPQITGMVALYLTNRMLGATANIVNNPTNTILNQNDIKTWLKTNAYNGLLQPPFANGTPQQTFSYLGQARIKDGVYAIHPTVSEDPVNGGQGLLAQFPCSNVTDS